eukprot:g421.t1
MRRSQGQRNHNLLDPIQPAPFLKKTYDLVNDSETDKVISWGPDENSFVVWEPTEFARDLLPRHFKHNNFSSFVRQLNTYGFRKIDPDRWEFSNENFLKAYPDALVHIQRRKPTQTQQNFVMDSTPIPNSNSAIEIGLFGGLKDEVENLKRDRNVLMLELVRLRQHQQWSENEIHRLHERIERGENRQSELLHLFTQYLQNPSILTSFLKHANRSRLDDHHRSRRKRRAQRSPSGSPTSSSTKERKLISYQRGGDLSPYPSSHEFTERLDRLLGSFQEETNGPRTTPFSQGLDPIQSMGETTSDWGDYFQSTPPALDQSDTVRAITNSPMPQLNSSDGVDLANETVVGMPVIPDSVSAGEFLAGLDLDREIQRDLEVYGPNNHLMLQTSIPGSPSRGVSASLSTPFAAGGAGGAGDDFMGQYPFLDAEEMLGFSDRSLSDDIWKRFLTTTTATTTPTPTSATHES